MPMKPFSMESREKTARIDNHRNVFRDAARPSPIGELYQRWHNASTRHSLTIARVLG